MIILKFVFFTYIVSYYVMVSYNNSEKLIFKIADMLATLILIATITYSIINFDVGIILGIITGFGVAVKLIFDAQAKSKKITNKQEKKIVDIDQELSMLNKCVNEITDGNYTASFVNGGYRYSENVLYLTELLARLQISYESSISDRKRLLSKRVETFSFEECMDYFNYVWHIEASLAVGTVKKQIESRRYVKVMEKFINYLDENRNNLN